MAYPTFEEAYQPRLKAFLERDVIGSLKNNLEHAKATNDADEAERLLDAACEQCIGQVKNEMDAIKNDVKGRRLSTTSHQNYVSFVQAVTTGIRQSEGIFQQVFSRIRTLITTVVDWIRRGINWIGETIQATFNAIQSFFR